MDFFKTSGLIIMVVRPFIQLLLLLLHLPIVKIPWFVHCVLFGGNNYSRINSSCIVGRTRTTTRVFVDIASSAAVLDDMFTIYHSKHPHHFLPTQSDILLCLW